MVKNIVIIILVIILVIFAWKFLKGIILTLVGLGILVLIVYLFFTWKK